MKFTTLSLILGAAFFVPATGAVAAPQDGVSCPSGSAASFLSGVLTCVTEQRVVKSVCPLGKPFMQRVVNGVDLCFPKEQVTFPPITDDPDQPPGYPTTEQQGVPTIPADLPFNSNSGWRRVIDGAPDTIGTDNFRKGVRRFIHPRGRIYVHNPRRGVQCAAGFTSGYNASSKTLKCKKVTFRLADCAFPWSLSVQRGKDVCKSGLKRTTTQPKDKFLKKGWELRIDAARGFRDGWLNVSYQYPQARR